MEENLVGTWNMDLETSYFGFSSHSEGTMVFYEDGTGFIDNEEEGSSSFTWTSDNNENGIYMENNGESFYLDNTLNTHNKQIFHYSETSDGVTMQMTFTLTK